MERLLLGGLVGVVVGGADDGGTVDGPHLAEVEVANAIVFAGPVTLAAVSSPWLTVTVCWMSALWSL